MKKVFTPYIHVSDSQVQIIGEPECLEALGTALLAKAKLGKCLPMTLTDGTNKPIIITSSDELPL